MAKTQLVLTTAGAASSAASEGTQGAEGASATAAMKQERLSGIVQQLQDELASHQSSTSTALLVPLLQLHGGVQSHLWSLAAAELEEGSAPQQATRPQSRPGPNQAGSVRGTDEGRDGDGEGDGESDGDSTGVCSFDALEVLAEGSAIIVRELHQLHEASLYPTSCLAVLLALVAHHPAVVDVRLRHDKTSFNNYIKSIVQSEVYGQGDALYPYLQAGLDGTGQVIGIGDSGLDERSCFFNEGDNSLMNRSDYSAPVTNLTRRKVVQYVAFKGGDDTPGGHGTQYVTSRVISLAVQM